MKIYVNAFIVSLLAILSTSTILAAPKQFGRSDAMGRPFVSDSLWSTNFRQWEPPVSVPMFSSMGRADIAWTDGYVIYYNPMIASQVPAKVFAFFIAHEYGHVYGKTSNENAADVFAARTYSQTDKSVCQAFSWWMTNFPNGGDWTHLPSPVRAQIVARECGI